VCILEDGSEELSSIHKTKDSAICRKIAENLNIVLKQKLDYFMKKFYVDYIDTNDDLCHIWVEANSKEEAIREAKREYWDIKNIIDVHG
jgi:cytidylate kinase